MAHVFVAVSAVVPSLLLVWYFHRRDVFREPARDLWLSFGGGILVVLPVLAIAVPVEWLIAGTSSPLLYGLAAAFLQAAIPEELFKLVVLWVVARRAAFDEPIDGVVYGVAASMGFATLENILYVSSGGLVVALTRAVTAVPSHAFLGAIMGYYVGRARFDPRRRGVSWGLALAIPILLHGAYDWPLLAASRVGQAEAASQPLILGLLSIAPLVVVGEWIGAVRLTRRLRLAQLAGLPAGAAPAAPTRMERWSTLALTGAGGVVASLGGLLSLGGLWMVVAGAVGGQPIGEAVAALLVAGLTPTIIGVALFLWGIRRLNEGRALVAAAA